MAQPVSKGSGKGRGHTLKNEAGVVGLKYTREYTNSFGDTYYTNKAAKKRIRKAIKEFYRFPSSQAQGGEIKDVP